jgi:membrane protease YdiL (CAAX protease family)
MTPDPVRARYLDAAVVVLVCFGMFVAESLTQVLSGAGPGPTDIATDASLFILILQECVLGALALSFLHVRGYQLRAFLPRPTAPDTALGALLYGAVALAVWVGQRLGGDAGPEPIDVLMAQAQFSIPAIVAVAIVNGFYEEFFLLGILTPLLARGGASFAIGCTVLLRVLYHVYQGPHGAVAAALFGITLGIFYWRTRRLWPAVCAHVIADLFGLAM